MKRTIIVGIAAILFCSCQDSQPTTVHLKGKLSVQPPVTLAYDGAVSMLGDSKNILLNVDSNGAFDTIINIDKPAYYSIRRNTLYLTPGDDMEIYITESSTEATFTGKGAEANEYMKYRLFPKGGSFLEAGRNVRSSFTKTKATIDSLAVLRLEQLNALTEVSDEFKTLETARINADIVNSCISYLGYSKYYGNVRDNSKEEYDKQVAIAIDTIAPVVNPIIQKLNEDKYLDVAVVRNIFYYANSDHYKKCFDGIAPSQRRGELYTAEEYINQLRESVTLEKINEYTEAANQLKNEDFKAELLTKIEQGSKLLPGKPAIDFEMETADGQKLMLSSFKGKPLYIDLWATWCGPCKAEAPHFNKLAKEFKGKDIVFLKISTDKKRSDWTKYLEHDDSGLTSYISNDIKLNDWAVYYIPRFILVDKDFNIIDAYAKRPSEEDIIDVLNGLLM